MKPAPFEYHRPTSLGETFDLLARHGDDARILAGGQSLVPALNMRLATPRAVIDINRLPGLDEIRAAPEGLVIGALARQAAVERSPVVARHAPLVAAAMPYIGHAATRSRGTFGGSLALADPAAELPACAVALDAVVRVASRRGGREIPAAAFFRGVYTTALEPGEIVTAVVVPPLGPGWTSAFDELARRHGDFALAGLAVHARMDGALVAEVRLVFFGVGAVPVRARRAEAALIGRRPDGDAVAAAAKELDAELDPPGDIHGSPALRGQLARVLLSRVVPRLAVGAGPSSMPGVSAGAARDVVPGAERTPARTGAVTAGEQPAAVEPAARAADEIAVVVNGKPVRGRVEPRQSLVDFLRLELQLTGSHVGCEHGVCGACTVRVDGALVRGCLMLAAQADGCRVETIEGLAERGELATLQQAFRLENALQCGFCTPGLLLTAHDLLQRVERPDPARIREAIGGNYCRCTGYTAIVQAIGRAAELRAGRPSERPAPAADGGYIGRSVVRPQTARLVAGRGQFTDDIALPRMAHVAFVRSPHAHARIVAIDTTRARALPGVIAVVTGEEMAARCEPWVGVLKNYPGMKSAPQYPLARGKAVWQGEPVVAVVAESRAIAEDGGGLVAVTWEPLPPVVDAEAALAPGATVIHPELGDNLVLESRVSAGDVDAAFAEADLVVGETYETGRHTVVSLEARVILADYEPAEGTLTVYHSGQAPYMLHDILSRHLRIPEHRVRVVNRDVGGSFGLKIHTYPDEIATCVLAVMLGRPVKFLADRIESFQTDIHSRDHRVRAEVAARRDGTIVAMRVDDLAPVGAYSMYPRSSVVESGQILRTTPGPYRLRSYAARGRVVFQNKTPMSQYRAVGHPVASLVMEAMVDRVARELGLDPVEVRRKNLVTADMYPYTAPSGLFFERLSHEASLARVLEMADYAALCRERDGLRARGVHRGLGLCVFLDLTVPGAQTYGTGGARISSQDGTTIRLEPTGKLTVIGSVTEQGQGTDTILAQVAATAVGVRIEDVRVLTGDTLVTPYGGGTWGSRGAGIGGEATLQSGKALKRNILEVAAAVLDVDPLALDVRDGAVVDAATGAVRLPLEELGRIAYFRPDTLPKDFQSELTVTRHYVPRHQPLAYTNGVQLSYVEVDVETGFVRLLGHWVAEDCGRIINPMLVTEQVRGGVAHGLGDALFEHCIYDEQGQLLTTTLMDYLVPMAVETPDIHVGHVETPTAYAEGGFKGAGEGGVAGAPGAVLNAVNDALSPFGVRITRVPITPEVVLRALGRI